MSENFFDSRTKWSDLKRWLLLEPLLGGSRWAAAFGSLLLFSFVVQVVTGILLAMNYSPSVQDAWPSVNFIMTEVQFGSLIRSMHHWGSSAMVILLLVHMVQVFVWGAYKKPREFTWMVGVLLLLVTLGLAFTGYLLPWDQKAYWATKVGLGIASTVPGVGENLKTLLQGGSQLGNLTLTRFFALHVFVLPGLLIGLVVAHLYLFRVHGVTPPWWESDEQLEAEKEPFWPGQAFKDAVFALVFLVVLIGWTQWWPAPLEPQADPSQPYQARPEWYFMFMFFLLQFFKGPYEIVGTFVLPTLFFGVLFFWPFLDRSPHRDPRRRPLAISLLGLGTFGLVGLTVFAIATDVRMQEPALAVAQTPPPPPQAGPVQSLDVAKLYSTHCASCHGMDGTGNPVRVAMPSIADFTGLAWQMSQTDLEITHGIREGKAPLMPPFADKLSQDQILALAIYVRAFAVAPPVLANEPSSEGLAFPSELKTIPTSGQPPATPITAGMSPTQIYRAYCLACHAEDGRGEIVRKAMTNIPDFTNPEWQAAHETPELMQAILNGKGQFMLPMKDKLGPSDAEAMVAVVRGFRGSEHSVPLEPEKVVTPPLAVESTVVPRPTAQTVPPTPAPAVVETSDRIRVAAQIYRQYCLTCHAVDGRGEAIRAAMPAIPSFADAAWQRRQSDPQLIAGILNGKGTLMPAFSGRVNSPQAADLVAYVRAFGPQSAAASATSPSDFETRFRELQDQWDELQRQIKSLPQ